MFDKTAITAWLNSLSSPHLLPSPLKRDSKHLTGDLVTLSQAVIWLSEGFSEDWLRLVGPSDYDANIAIAHLTDPRVDPIEPSIWLAGYLAHTTRKLDVERVLLSSLRDRKITAHGIAALESGVQRTGDAEGIEIPQDQFKVARRLILANSCIGVDHEAVVDAESETKFQSNWEHVRFYRADLVRLWGDID